MDNSDSLDGIHLRFPSSALLQAEVKEPFKPKDEDAPFTTPKDEVVFTTPEMFVDLDNQSRVVDEALRIRTGHLGINGESIPDRFYPEVVTCWDAFLRGRCQSLDGRCYGLYSEALGDWVYKSYDDVYQSVMKVGSALVTLGLVQSSTTPVGIYAKNCLEWNVLEYTCYANSMMVTPLYDTFGKEAVVNIINETEMSFVFVDDEAKLTTLLMRRREMPNLKMVATKFQLSEEIMKSAAEDKNPLRLMHFPELEALGAKNLKPIKPPKKDDIAVLMYTSGTTGMPKGAMLSHDNIIFTIHMWYFQIHKGPHGELKIGPDHCILTCLPKAHLMALCTGKC